MAPSAPDRLDGWKAIADYLHRDVRTLQRWRDERGMPVHRVPGKGGTVFAYPTELDTWLREAATMQNAEPPAVAAEPGNEKAVGPGARASTWWRGWRGWLAGAAALAMASIAVATLGLPLPARAFERAELRDGNLVALDAERQPVWSFKLPERSAGPSASAALLFPILKDAAPIDLDGDGERELVAFLAFLEQPNRAETSGGEVYCFSSKGSLLWTFKPELTLTFDGRTFTGPWQTRDWLVAGPTAPLWVSFSHHTWWPSFVITLDGKGRSKLRFVNAGHIESFGRVATASGTYVLAGGTNNDYGRAASLAILDEEGSPATSPPSGTAYTCDGCPTGHPAKYLLFPRSELNIAMGNARNVVQQFTLNQTGGVEVTVREHTDPPLRSIYRLSTDFTPQWVAMSDAYWETHLRRTSEGKLNHSPEECPERKRGMPVRSWDPQSGWKELRVPYAFAPAHP